LRLGRSAVRFWHDSAFGFSVLRRIQTALKRDLNHIQWLQWPRPVLFANLFAPLA
jgi:hypothetical protein